MTTTIGRTFGIEIETIGLSEDAATRALEGVVDVHPASYSSRDYSEWSVKGDSSLQSPNGRAAEIVSPILRWGNADHYRQVEAVTKALRDAGARVNRSCGLHVHVGASDLSRTEVLGVVRSYTAAQHAINSIVAPSRVDGQWAGTYPAWNNTVPYARRTWDEFADQFTRSGYNSFGRYMTVNLSPYADRGTVEFRQRNGSLNARKILTWAGLMMSLTKLGAETECRDSWAPYTEAGQDADSVYAWLAANGSLDEHAEVWRSGQRPLAPAAPVGSFARLLSLQGV